MLSRDTLVANGKPLLWLLVELKVVCCRLNFRRCRHVCMFSFHFFVETFVINTTFCRYPAWQKGSPQLRIFLPDFWMKLVKPPHPIPKYEVQFLISPQMTKYDVKQYLEKIYNVPVVHVNIHNKIGKWNKYFCRRIFVIV